MDETGAFNRYIELYSETRKRWIKGWGHAHRSAMRYMLWQARPYTPTTPRGKQATMPYGDTVYRMSAPRHIETDDIGEDIADTMRLLMTNRKEWKIYKGPARVGPDTTEHLFWKGWPNGN